MTATDIQRIEHALSVVLGVLAFACAAACVSALLAGSAWAILLAAMAWGCFEARETLA